MKQQTCCPCLSGWLPRRAWACWWLEAAWHTQASFLWLQSACACIDNVAVCLRNCSICFAVAGFSTAGHSAGSLAVVDPASQEDLEAAEKLKLQLAQPLPSRQQQWQRLCDGTRSSPFDLFIIGGGATGTGCAVDAATRHEPL